jgi:hypothetical protein
LQYPRFPFARNCVAADPIVSDRRQSS